MKFFEFFVAAAVYSYGVEGAGECLAAPTCKACLAAVEDGNNCNFCLSDDKLTGDCQAAACTVAGSAATTDTCPIDSCADCTNDWQLTLQPEGVRASCPAEKCAAATVLGAIVKCIPAGECTAIANPGVEASDLEKLSYYTKDPVPWAAGSCYRITECAACLKAEGCKFAVDENSKQQCVPGDAITEDVAAIASITFVTDEGRCPAPNAGSSFAFVATTAAIAALMAVTI